MADARLREALTTSLFLLFLCPLLDLSPGLWASSSNYGHMTIRELIGPPTGEAPDVTGLHCCQQALHLSDFNPPTPIQARPPPQGDSAPGSFPSCHQLRRVTGYHGDRKEPGSYLSFRMRPGCLNCS